MVRLCARCGGPGVGSAVESVPGALEKGYSVAAEGAEAWRNRADRFQLRQVRLIGGAQTPAGQVGQRGAEFAEIRPLVRAAREPDDHDCPHMAWARLGRLRAPAMASALRRELVRLGHRLFGAGTAYGARARLVRRRLVAGADRAAACGRGLAIDPPWARTGERHAGRRGYWGTCTCCDPRFRDWLV